MRAALQKRIPPVFAFRLKAGASEVAEELGKSGFLPSVCIQAPWQRCWQRRARDALKIHTRCLRRRLSLEA